MTQQSKNQSEPSRGLSQQPGAMTHAPSPPSPTLCPHLTPEAVSSTTSPSKAVMARDTMKPPNWESTQPSHLCLAVCVNIKLSKTLKVSKFRHHRYNYKSDFICRTLRWANWTVISPPQPRAGFCSAKNVHRLCEQLRWAPKCSEQIGEKFPAWDCQAGVVPQACTLRQTHCSSGEPSDGPVHRPGVRPMEAAPPII